MPYPTPTITCRHCKAPIGKGTTKWVSETGASLCAGTTRLHLPAPPSTDDQPAAYAVHLPGAHRPWLGRPNPTADLQAVTWATASVFPNAIDAAAAGAASCYSFRIVPITSYDEPTQEQRNGR
jgi:hypothetical protein